MDSRNIPIPDDLFEGFIWQVLIGFMDSGGGMLGNETGHLSGLRICRYWVALSRVVGVKRYVRLKVRNEVHQGDQSSQACEFLTSWPYDVVTADPQRHLCILNALPS
jgi:hypothetical protein